MKMESEKCDSEKEAKVCYTNSGFSIDIPEIKEKAEIIENVPKEKGQFNKNRYSITQLNYFCE
jgi:hypothetical protein